MTRNLSRRQLEVRRLEASLAIERAAYAEQWVAIKGYHVVAAGSGPKQVLAALEAASITGAALDFVPKPDTIYILAAGTPA